LGRSVANRDAIEEYLREGRAEFARLGQQARSGNPALYAKLDAARAA